MSRWPSTELAVDDLLDDVAVRAAQVVVPGLQVHERRRARRPGTAPASGSTAGTRCSRASGRAAAMPARRLRARRRPNGAVDGRALGRAARRPAWASRRSRSCPCAASTGLRACRSRRGRAPRRDLAADHVLVQRLDELRLRHRARHGADAAWRKRRPAASSRSFAITMSSSRDRGLAGRSGSPTARLVTRRSRRNLPRAEGRARGAVRRLAWECPMPSATNARRRRRDHRARPARHAQRAVRRAARRPARRVRARRATTTPCAASCSTSHARDDVQRGRQPRRASRPTCRSSTSTSAIERFPRLFR